MRSYLNDKFLLDKSKIKTAPPSFLTKISQDQLKKFLNKCKDSNLKDSNIKDEAFSEFYPLWKLLLNDSITFLKSRDKREYLKKKPEREKVAFGVDSLYNYFKDFNSFEALLYGSDTFYRDHVRHVFRVWLIGIWLLNKFGSVKFDLDNPLGKLRERSRIRRSRQLHISEEEICAMWCIIALTHDLGYPLDKINKIRDRIDSMMTYFGGTESTESFFKVPTHHHFINDFILRLISSKLVPDNLKTALQTKFYLKFSRSFELFSHGIVSCILLMKTLVYFLESDLDLQRQALGAEDARQFYIRREILRTIASHTCTDIYHLVPNSLAFILILSDELQVWGRPTFHEIQSSRYLFRIKPKVPMISIDDIKMEVVIVETEKAGGGEEYIFAVFRKWHKYLRSALDAGYRTFSFSLLIKLKPLKGRVKQYSLVSEPGKDIRVKGEKRGVRVLYKNT